MNMKSPRLDDKLNGVALATILAIVLSIVSAGVSVVAGSGVMIGVSSASSARVQTLPPAKLVASASLAVIGR